MVILAGIDEAGFGPLLGPLVVSATAFWLPDDLVKADLWQVLSASIGKKRKGLAGRLLVTDSKKAYNRSVGIAHLCRSVLAALKALGETPEDLTALIRFLCPDCLERLRQYPWYRDIQDCPVRSDAGDITIAANVLKKNLAANEMRLLAVRSHILDVGYYNRLVGRVKNKASVLFTTVSSLISELNNTLDGHGLQIIVDRQGGRVNYAGPLMRMFPDMKLTILRQDSSASSYELADGNKKMRLHFATEADQRFLPVSLASMVSKFLRELLIDCINRYFVSRCVDLKPTAGYWKDGQRFISDLKQNPHLKYDSNQLIRSR